MVVRVAALYDIHGNLPALEAVLEDVSEARPDIVLIGGDIVPGPMPRETLELLLELADEVVFIRGNADRELASGTRSDDDPWAERARWTAEQMTSEQLDLLAGLPKTVVLEVEGLGPVLFCHGSPRSDEEILTRATPPERLSDVLAGVEQRIVVCGHTHVQFDRIVGGVRLVNAGSVGMPYEGEPGVACWAILGPEVELRRTSYDIEQAAARVRATGYPDAEEFIDEYLLHPASADEATEHFERMAGES